MRRSVPLVAAAAVGLIALAACSSNSGGSGSSNSPSSTTSASSSSSGIQVGVLLPDTQSSTRWESYDRPFLTQAFAAAGVKVLIDNALGSATTQATQAQQMITQGAKVLLLVNLDSGSGAAIERTAAAAGVKTIDYDRLTLGGSASVYVSFNNVTVGQLQGQGLVKCLQAKGYSKPKVAELNGSPTDNNATLFAQGYNSVLDPLYANGTFTKGPNQSVPQWNNQQGGVIFEGMLTTNPDIKGVLSANDGLGGAVLAILKKNNLEGKVPFTGQDATIAGMQNILLGYQCMSVYKPIKVEADAAAAAAIALLRGQTPATNGNVTDPTTKKLVVSILETPIAVTTANMEATVIKDNFDTAAQICAGAVAAACTKYGIH
jgi:D-xylose transport system substrate-binding protein